MEILYFYPIKNDQSFEKKEALALYMDAMGSAIARFEKPDSLGKFASVIAFLKCLDQTAIDMACLKKGLNEADFRALVYDSDLLEEKQVLDMFTRVAKEINKHLEHGA